MAKKLSVNQDMKSTEDYIAFLEKRLASENYRNNVPWDDYNKEREKLKKARFRLKTLKVRLGIK